jgi:hypothetical protein
MWNEKGRGMAKKKGKKDAEFWTIACSCPIHPSSFALSDFKKIN